jgi:hypothetical protein
MLMSLEEGRRRRRLFEMLDRLAWIGTNVRTI